MKQPLRQAARKIGEAVHQIGRIAQLLLVVGLGSGVMLAFRLSQGPIELPGLASRVATALSGQGISVQVAQAELAWNGYQRGADVPISLRLGGIVVRNAAGTVFASIPHADLILPPPDLFGAHDPFLVSGDDARFTGTTAPVSWSGELWPGKALTLRRGLFAVTLGAGHVGTGTMAEDINGGSFTLDMARNDVTLSHGVLVLAPHGASAPRLSVSLTAQRAALWQGDLTMGLDTVQAADLPTYWPPPLLPKTRHWVVTHITAGEAHDALFSFHLAVTPALSHVALTDASGQFAGHNLTLSWLLGVAPITGLTGVFTLPNTQEIDITATAGQEDGLRLAGGSFTIRGLKAPEQDGLLDVHAGGTLPDLVRLINTPPLRVLRVVPPGLVAATGNFTGELTADIPFESTVTAESMHLHVGAALHNVAFVSVLPPLAFTSGDGTLTVTPTHVHAQAQALFAGQSSSLTVDLALSLRNPQQDVTLVSAAGVPVLHMFNLDSPTALGGAVQGVAPFRLRVTGDAVTGSTAQLDADLTPLTWSVARLGWAKTAGQAGALSLTLGLQKGLFTGLQALHATAPGLDVTASGGGGKRVEITAAHIGRTSVSGSVMPPAQPGDPWQVTLQGDDLAYIIGAAGKPEPHDRPPPDAPTTGVPWRATLSVHHLYLAPTPAPALQQVSLTASGQGAIIQNAEGTGADGFTLTVVPVDAQRRRLTVQANDAGLALHALGIFNDLRGGTLSLTSTYGLGIPAAGSAQVSGFTFDNAPYLAKILQALTVYGLADATSGPGLVFDHAEIPFSQSNGVLTLTGARAYSSSLGFTANGTLDFNAGVCDVEATVVPAYALNTLPSRIPLLGRLFSAEKGGGLLAMRAHITGPLTDPQVLVNPLSALTPGFLRNIFGVGP